MCKPEEKLCRGGGNINQCVHFHDPTSIGNKLGQFLINVPLKVTYLSPQYKHLLFLAGFVYLCIVAMFLHIAAVIRDFVSPFNCNHIHITVHFSTCFLNFTWRVLLI